MRFVQAVGHFRKYTIRYGTIPYANNHSESTKQMVRTRKDLGRSNEIYYGIVPYGAVLYVTVPYGTVLYHRKDNPYKS